MFRLSLILHLFIGSTIMGIAIIVALVAGVSSPMAILWLAVAGFVLAFPASYLVARKLYENG